VGKLSAARQKFPAKFCADSTLVEPDFRG